MAEEIASEKKDFQLSRAHDLDLSLYWVILHTIVHHSSTFTYVTNFIEIEDFFVDGRTDGRTYERTYGRRDGTFETYFIRSTQKSIKT